MRSRAHVRRGEASRLRLFLPLMYLGFLLVAALPARAQNRQILASTSAPSSSVRIAFLGPLTGQYAPLGRRALRILEWVSAGMPGVEVTAFDTAESPVSAYEDAIELAPWVVVGPVGELETREVLAARQASAPAIFPLAAWDGMEAPLNGVYRLRPSGREEGEALALLADLATPNAEIAVLAVDTTWGRDAAAAFITSWTEQGGTVANVVLAEEDRRGDVDYRDQAELLVGRKSLRLDRVSSSRGPLSRISTRAGTQDQPDGVVILDRGERVADWPLFLNYYGWLAEDGVQIYAGSAWVSPRMEVVGEFIANSLALTSWHSHSTSNAAQEFGLRFAEELGAQASAWDAEVFDAYRFILFHLVGRTSPPPAQSWSRFDEPWTGASGRQELERSGAVLRTYETWRADGGGYFYPVSPDSLRVESR